MTSCAEAPYIVNLLQSVFYPLSISRAAYPDATSSVPGASKSSTAGLLPLFVISSESLEIAKMVPTDTPASKLLLPSIGSHATKYLAFGCSSK